MHSTLVSSADDAPFCCCARIHSARRASKHTYRHAQTQFEERTDKCRNLLPCAGISFAPGRHSSCSCFLPRVLGPCARHASHSPHRLLPHQLSDLEQQRHHVRAVASLPWQETWAEVQQYWERGMPLRYDHRFFSLAHAVYGHHKTLGGQNGQWTGGNNDKK